MSRIFKENGFSGKDIIPFESFRLMLDRTDEIVFDKEKGDAAVRAAERVMQKPHLPILKASEFKMFSENGNRMIWERPYHQRRADLVVLSLAEAYQGEGKYLDAIIDYLWLIFEESTWVIPAHQWNIPSAIDNKFPIVIKEGVMHGIDLFSATTAASLTTAYLAVGKKLDEISPIICERLKYEINKRIIQPFLQLRFGWSGVFGDKPNNWCTWIVCNVLYVGAVFEEDLSRRQALAQRAMDYLDNFTANYPADGGCDEGPNYWTSAGSSYFDSAELLYDMSGGKIDVFGEELVRNMCEYEAKFFIDGVNFLNFADSVPTVANNGSNIRRMGQRLGSDILVAFSETVTKYHPISLEANHGYRVYRHMFDKNVVSDESVGFTEVWLPDLKVMVKREFPETNKGLYLALKGGNNDESHNHNDLGNVVVYYGGKPVFIDAGSGEYTKLTFSEKRYTLWNTQSGYHNTVTIGGVMQMNGASFVTGDEKYCEKDGSLSLELKDAYPKEAGIESLVRRACLKDGRVEITDKIKLISEKEVDIHFITPTEPEIDGEKISLAEGRTLIYDEKLTPEIEAFDIDESFKGRWKTNRLYRIHLKATVQSGEFTNYIE